MTSIVKKNVVTEGSEAIKVFVRVRPELQRERESAESDDHAVTFVAKDELRVKSRVRDATCKFDRVFPPQTTQVDVYNAVKDCAQNCIDGFNSTCFAYGQTGSGKTFTMFGDEAVGNDLYSANALSAGAGLIPRIIRDIFAHVKRNRKTCTAVVSFMQIYNENIYDLLRDPGRGRTLTIKEDSAVGLYVDGLSEFIVANEGECLKLLRAGDESRAVRHTEMNDYSSRSHTIFQIVLETTNPTNPDAVTRSKLNLVDLAGSEKWNIHSFMGDAHAAELSNINLSLTVLRRCMEALSKPNTKQQHVPYRDSKLTRLLQDSIGGTAKTRLLCMMSPVAANAEESQATLRFADCAKNVMQHTRVTEIRVIDEDMVERMEKELAQLRLKVIQYEGSGMVPITPPAALSAPVLPRISQRREAGAAEEGEKATVSTSAGENDAAFKALSDRHGMLVGVVEAMDRVITKFFRFELEEDDLQTEMMDHLHKARSIIKVDKTSVGVRALPYIAPTPTTASYSPSTPTTGYGRENKPPAGGTRNARPGKVLKHMKFRVRKKGDSERGNSTVIDPFADEEAESVKLKAKLLAAQKKVEKQKKIQEYLKKKADREDEIYREENALIEKERKAALEREASRKARAKEQKDKLLKWKQEQLAELDSLLMAE